jgi:hypothetical protein
MELTEKDFINSYYYLRNKEYRLNNQDKLKERFQCSCGMTYSYGNKASHQRSNKHQRHINYPIKLYNVNMPSDYYLNKFKLINNI